MLQMLLRFSNDNAVAWLGYSVWKYAVNHQNIPLGGSQFSQFHGVVILLLEPGGIEFNEVVADLGNRTMSFGCNYNSFHGTDLVVIGAIPSTPLHRLL
jgi:hypothetical protein